METFLVLLYAILSMNSTQAIDGHVGEGMDEMEFSSQQIIDTGNDIRREIQEARLND